MPSEKSSFTPSSILFRPRPRPRVVLKKHGLGWRRRVPPPGPIGLLRSSFIAIAAASAGKMNIRAPTTFRKGCRRAPTQKLQGIELQSYRLRAAVTEPSSASNRRAPFERRRRRRWSRQRSRQPASCRSCSRRSIRDSSACRRRRGLSPLARPAAAECPR